MNSQGCSWALFLITEFNKYIFTLVYVELLMCDVYRKSMLDTDVQGAFGKFLAWPISQ